MAHFELLEAKLKALGIKPFRGSTFNPATQSDLHQIEQLLGARLPDDYRHFLTKFGECGFERNVVFLLDVDYVDFGYFFGVPVLIDGIQSPPDTMPDTMFPIGDEGLGNYYCMAFRGREPGSIYYWNQHIGWEAEADEYLARRESVPADLHMKCVTRIAGSFEQFIESMDVKP
jgi:hypothetical protein